MKSLNKKTYTLIFVMLIMTFSSIGFVNAIGTIEIPYTKSYTNWDINQAYQTKTFTALTNYSYTVMWNTVRTNNASATHQFNWFINTDPTNDGYQVMVTLRNTTDNDVALYSVLNNSATKICEKLKVNATYFKLSYDGDTTSFYVNGVKEFQQTGLVGMTANQTVWATSDAPASGVLPAYFTGSWKASITAYSASSGAISSMGDTILGVGISIAIISILVGLIKRSKN